MAELSQTLKNGGLRKLAYPIKKHDRGYYVLFNFEQEAESINDFETIDNLNRYYNENESENAIMKHIIVRADNY